MPSVISFHTLHDANVSIVVDGELKVILELERYFDVRYFCSNPVKSTFIQQWTKAIEVVTTYTGISDFDIGVTSWVLPSQRALIQELVKAKQWLKIDHHVCHASLAFYDSSFNKALILSYDGAGNDGTFNVYLGDRSTGITHQKRVELNLGQAYRQLAITMPEVTNQKKDSKDMTTYMRVPPLALSGKVMGYAALGRVRSEWLPALREYYNHFTTPLASMFTLGEQLDLALEPNNLDESDARDLAATSQFAFSQLLMEQVEEHLTLNLREDIDGIVLTGGCALNVHANQLVVEKFGLPVHVASAPNDCGISVGAAWIVDPPRKMQRIQYQGLPCFDSSALRQLICVRKPKQVTAKEVAALLLDGAIVAVVRGRQEFGPRALGHRSLLCYPDKPELKEKLNTLKSREWYRPLCPSVAIESVPKLFEGRNLAAAQKAGIEDRYPSQVKPHCQHLCISSLSGEDESEEMSSSWVPASPYMSFAPMMKPEARKMFPAVCHYDGTARLQTVGKEDDAWYHSLLTEVAALNGGYGILLNTSFNVKGKPILNRLSTAMTILDNSPEDSIEYLLIEDWLFQRDNENKT